MTILAIMPIPIPMSIYMRHGGGTMPDNALLALFLAFNLFFITLYLIRTAIWFYKLKVKKERFFNGGFINYVIWSDVGVSMFISMFFISWNSLALLFLVTNIIMKILNGQ